ILSGLLLFLVTIPAERKSEHQLKRHLIREMGGQDHGLALRATNELRAYGWLMDGSLKGADLLHANLQGASLQVSNLQEANLHGANLEGADLAGANLKGANLMSANLEGADLMGA